MEEYSIFVIFMENTAEITCYENFIIIVLIKCLNQCFTAGVGKHFGRKATSSLSHCQRGVGKSNLHFKFE